MLELRMHRFEVHQKRLFKVSYGSYSMQRCIVVELIDQGHSGFGEATVFAKYGVTEPTLADALDRARRALDGGEFTTPSALREIYLPLIGHCPFACAALDAAAWDLFGKILGKPVIDLLDLPERALPPSAYSIGIESVEKTARRAAEIRDWPIVKLKLGAENDIARVEAVREVTPAALRVDANGAWGHEETLRKAEQLERLGVESIEQPLAADDWKGMELISGRAALPIFADEACHSPETFEAALGLFDGVTLKTMKVGGLSAALAMVHRAKAAGRSVALGCMPESTIGVSSTIQIAPLADQLEIDSIVLISNDLAEGVTIDRGEVIPTRLPGLGFRVLFPTKPAGAGSSQHAVS